MSYEEKGAWVYLVTSAGAYLTYLVIVLRRLADTPVSEVAYVSVMLWAIGLSIAASIIGRIAVEIAKPSDNHKIDVRDREINRFGEYVGGTILAISMMAPLGLALAEFDYFWVTNAMYAAYTLSALVGASVKLFVYKRGM
jgi:hypothetical protein